MDEAVEAYRKKLNQSGQGGAKWNLTGFLNP
jgi:hypothetical protein